jgi:hypothetical protein
MTVKINVIGPEGTSEYQDALSLRGIFETGLPGNAHGRINIASGVQLYGQNPRDVDIVVFGKLDSGAFDLKTNTYQEKSEYKIRKIFIASFFFCIESKRHNPEDIEMVGTNLHVRYGSNKHDATNQSEGQKYSIINRLKQVNPDPRVWVCNFLWMRNLGMRPLNELVGKHEHNVLPNSFDLKYLFQKACLQNIPREIAQGNRCFFSSINRGNGSSGFDYDQLQDLFTGSRQATGALTRRNVERIVGKKITIEPTLQDALEKKLIIVAGRAGTGKTVKMLRIGCELATNQGKRCLFLTYNRPLARDIERTLYFADVPSEPDSPCITVMTIHEFVRSIGIALGVTSSQEYDVKKHIDLCSDLFTFVNQGAITKEDILALMQERQELVCWDQIFVDEAQDFHEVEKKFLFELFGYQRVVIADGIDQFVRGVSRLDWGKNIYVIKETEKRSLRQKRNLADFVSSYSQEIELDWKIEAVPELLGGQVIVSSQLAPFQVLNEIRKRCYEQGNKAYEMLFLVPPNLVAKNKDGSREFKMLEEFDNNGFKLWDGTQGDLRLVAPPEVNQHRLLQYDSCRGLEGWVVVCLGFDDFIEYKKNFFKDTGNKDTSETTLVAMDSEEMCKRYVGLWSLIPLTRAIDSLVITFSNPDGDIAKTLKSCSNEDYVKFI